VASNILNPNPNYRIIPLCNAHETVRTKSETVRKESETKETRDLLSEDNFNVAGARHVGVDATVGTVRPAASVASLVHLFRIYPHPSRQRTPT
jgi:hypothetical protein